MELREKAQIFKQRAEESYLSKVLYWEEEEEQKKRTNGASSSLSSSSSVSSSLQDDVPHSTRGGSRHVSTAPVRSAAESPSPVSDQLVIEDIENGEVPQPYSAHCDTDPPCTCNKPLTTVSRGDPLVVMNRWGKEHGSGGSYVRRLFDDASKSDTSPAQRPRQFANGESTSSTPISKTSQTESLPQYTSSQQPVVGSTVSGRPLERTTPVKEGLLSSTTPELNSSSLNSSPSSSVPTHRRYMAPIYPSTSRSQFRSSSPPANPPLEKIPQPARSTAYSRQLPISTRITIKPSTVQPERSPPSNTRPQPVPQLDIHRTKPPSRRLPLSSSGQSYSRPTPPSHSTRPPPPPSPPPPSSLSRPLHPASQTRHSENSCATCGAKLHHVGPTVNAQPPHLQTVLPVNTFASTRPGSQYRPSQYSNIAHSRAVEHSRPLEADNVSVSSLSFSSNCSVASQVLQRARERRDRFWTAQHTE